MINWLWFAIRAQEAAEQSAELMASRQRMGRPVELRDTMIAAIVLARRATLATRNVAHFEDLTAGLQSLACLRAASKPLIGAQQSSSKANHQASAVASV